jgi:hypothetical protein
MNRNLLFLGGLGLGAGLMYIFDPDRGGRRRATARDAAHQLANAFDDAVGKTSRDLRNRAQGLVAELDSIFRCEDADDDKTVVDVRLSYYPPAGAVGHAIASLFGADPKSEMDDDLMRMKSFIETGHQPHDAADRKMRGGAAH